MKNVTMRDRITTAFAGRRVLVTGHSGFKGAWLSYWLHQLGATVGGLSLEPDEAQRPLFELISQADTFDSSVFATITDRDVVTDAVDSFEPEIVFHLAAQPLVRLSYDEPVETFDVNVMGTAHLLNAVRHSSIRAIVCVTTDKCYENTDQIWPYRETDAMGGHDPYSASKGAAELVISSFRRSFFPDGGAVACASARAGNVVGGGDLSANRLIPDLYRAMASGEPLAIRNPNATRPWQHVLESLSGYIALAAHLWTEGTDFAGGWNFGPDPSERVSVGEFVSIMNSELSDEAPTIVEQPGGPHEAARLSLDITKAADYLTWTPVLSIEERARLTVEWFRADASGRLDIDLVDRQIKWFESRWLGS